MIIRRRNSRGCTRFILLSFNKVSLWLWVWARDMQKALTATNIMLKVSTQSPVWVSVCVCVFPRQDRNPLFFPLIPLSSWSASVNPTTPGEAISFTIWWITLLKLANKQTSAKHESMCVILTHKELKVNQKWVSWCTSRKLRWWSIVNNCKKHFINSCGMYCIKNNSETVLTAQPKAQSCGVAFQPCNHRTNKYCYSTRANNWLSSGPVAC